ncbi:MAG: hypothetical protein Q8P41_26425 [Pseudomonadota bacterium]|nr:hypothetical protein [Pseudomonadota bacterium]
MVDASLAAKHPAWMDGYRIRRGREGQGGFERSVPDEAALKALVATGEVRPSDEVSTGTGWLRVDQHPVFRGSLPGADPWSAWSDVDSVDAASLYRKMVDTPPPPDEDAGLVELPVDALSPVWEIDGRPEPAAPPTRPPALLVPPPPPPEAPQGAARGPRALHEVDRAPRPVPVPPVSPQPLPEDGAEVIAFPRARPPARDLVLPPEPRRRPPPPPLVRSSRVATLVFVGLAVVALGYAWIRLNSYTGVGAGTRPRPSSSASTKGVVVPPSPLVALDVELRAALSPHPRDVKEAGDLSDALLVELLQQRLDVIDANGVVTKWVGRKGDEPKSAEVRISYRSAGDLSRELGGIALVVGRYKRFYRLDIPLFEVTEVGTRGVTRIDAANAESYYQARITLEDLLLSLTKP